MVQERDAAVLRAQMRDALAAAAETEATSAADASAARAEWAGEAAQLAADRDIQLSHIEEAAAAHKKDLEVRFRFNDLTLISDCNRWPGDGAAMLLSTPTRLNIPFGKQDSLRARIHIYVNVNGGSPAVFVVTHVDYPAAGLV